MKEENNQIIKLKEILPGASDEALKKIDSKIKTEVSSLKQNACIDLYQDQDLFRIIRGVVLSEDDRNIKKIQKQIVEYYLENDNQLELQENWFCLFAYILSIILMVLRIIEVKPKTNDVASLALYVGLMVIWIPVANSKCMMNKNVGLWLSSFNRCAPSITFIGGTMFYLTVVSGLSQTLLIIIVVLSVIITSYLTITLHRKAKKE